MGDWEDAQQEAASSTGTGWYKPKNIPVGKSEEIVINKFAKITDPTLKFPVKDKAGKSLGYTWRFFFADGRVWDVSNNNRKILLAALQGTEKGKFVPQRVRVTNTGIASNRASQYRVEILGPAGQHQPVGTSSGTHTGAVDVDDDVSF